MTIDFKIVFYIFQLEYFKRVVSIKTTDTKTDENIIKVYYIIRIYIRNNI